MLRLSLAVALITKKFLRELRVGEEKGETRSRLIVVSDISPICGTDTHAPLRDHLLAAYLSRNLTAARAYNESSHHGAPA